VTLKDDLRHLGEHYPGHFENDPGPEQEIPLEVQFEDTRACGISLETLRKNDPEFAVLYEEYLRRLSP
jgi:hypothetical protein